jgi:hypothetical protein
MQTQATQRIDTAHSTLSKSIEEYESILRRPMEGQASAGPLAAEIRALHGERPRDACSSGLCGGAGHGEPHARPRRVDASDARDCPAGCGRASRRTATGFAWR